MYLEAWLLDKRDSVLNSDAGLIVRIPSDKMAESKTVLNPTTENLKSIIDIYCCYSEIDKGKKGPLNV